MAQPFPFTWYSCPCTNTSVSATEALSNPAAASQEQDEEQDFDPRSLRANYVLYPIEHLLYCEDCHQIRCTRCSTDEVLCYFCPSCLFEVPNSMVKSEGNRCTRNCYSCPLCTATLTVNSLEAPPQSPPHLAPPQASSSVPTGPFYLSCPYCQWTSLDSGIQFDKPSNISAQLSKLRSGGRVVSSLKDRERERDKRKAKDDSAFSALSSKLSDSPTVLSPDSDSAPMSTLEEEAPDLETEEAFANLNAFYRYQLADSASGESGGLGALHNINFGSPSSLTRIMNLYSGGTKKSQKQKPRAMREAFSRDEGFRMVELDAEDDAIAKMKLGGWEATTSMEQRLRQIPNQLPPASDGGPEVRFVETLRPVPALLESKRAKRCKTCRHILAKPENKVHSTRYRIKLLALNYVPRLTLRALSAPPVTNLTAAFAGLGIAPTLPDQLDYNALKPGMTTQFLLTVRNPLFDSIKVTLATPATVSGSLSRVTILCPQFEVGANTDVWDEALSGSGATSNRNSVSSARRGAESALTGNSNNFAPVQAEAGKVWEKGRNWSSVIVEVVPMPVDKERRETEEDADVLEIPVFVRVEFQTEAVDSVGGKSGKGGEKEEREWAFWCVLGAGRIAL